MPTASERYNDHGIHQALSDLQSRLKEVPKDLRKQTNEVEPAGSIERLEEVLEYVEGVLGAVDPALVTPAMLNAVESQFQQTRSALDTAIDQSDPGQAQSITNGTEAVLDAIGAWPMTTAMGSAEAKKAASALGKASREGLRSIKKDTDQMKGEVAELRQGLDQSKSQAEQTTQEQIGQITGQVEQIKTEIDAERTRAQETVVEIQDRFNAEQEGRNEQFEELKTETREKTDQLDQELRAEADRVKGELTQKAEETSQGIEQRGDELVAALEQKRQEAERLVDLVATSSTAGAFGKEADQQKEEADTWRMRAIWLAGAAAAVTLFAIVYAIAGHTTLPLAVSKVAAVVLLTGLATYAANQSGHHREREVRARRLELQMTAFGPITEPLNDPEAEKEVRKGFIERMFPGDPVVSDDGGGLTKEDVSLVGQLLREIKNAVS
jgi:hypothetical protein